MKFEGKYQPLGKTRALSPAEAVVKADVGLRRLCRFQFRLVYFFPGTETRPRQRLPASRPPLCSGIGRQRS